MEDGIAKAASQGEACAYPEHDCFDSLGECWHNQKDCTFTTCGTCKNITRFRYKSFGRRLKTAFFRELV